MGEEFGRRYIVLDVQRHTRRAHALRNEAIAEMCRSVARSTRSVAISCISALAHAAVRHRTVLDGEHEHRTGLGLARAEPAALAASVGRAARVKDLIAAVGRWGDNLATQIVAESNVLLPGLSGLIRREAQMIHREGRSMDKSSPKG